MANYLFMDYPDTINSPAHVYAVLYNPTDLKLFWPGGSPAGWYTAGGITGGVNNAGLNASALSTTGVLYVTAPAEIEDDAIIAKWFYSTSATKNMAVDTPIGSSSFTPAASTTTVSSGDITAIANKVVNMLVTDAGTLNKHSLGALVLALTNADTTSVAGKLVSRNPATDAIVHQYDIQTGHGQPIKSIT